MTKNFLKTFQGEKIDELKKIWKKNFQETNLKKFTRKLFLSKQKAWIKIFYIQNERKTQVKKFCIQNKEKIK